MVKLLRPVGLSRPVAPQPIPEKPEQKIATPSSVGALLHPAEASKRLSVSEHTLERWRGTGEGPPFVKFTSKTLRYRAVDLDAFVAARLVTSTAR